jgi:hypothetical protein
MAQSLLGYRGYTLGFIITVIAVLASGCTPAVSGVTRAPSATQATQGSGSSLSPRTTELSNWAGGFFLPTVAKRDDACTRGYASAQGNSEQLGYGVIETLIGPIAVQSVYGSIYNTCRATALDLEPQPTGLPLLGAIVYVHNDNYTQQDYYEAYQVAFVALDAGGKELVRLTPTSQELGGQSGYGKPFRWLSFFDPNTFSANTFAALEQAASYQLLINRNNGVEVYEVSPTTFTNLQ